jgi:hypothetical protein
VAAAGSHIFIAILVLGQMHGAEGSSTNLFVYGVLIDPVMRPAIIFVAGEFDLCI